MPGICRILRISKTLLFRKGGVVVKLLEQLDYHAEGRGTGRVNWRLENSLCQPSNKVVPFGIREGQGDERERWAPPFICCGRDTVGL